MSELFYSPFFGITLTIAAFEIGLFINKKTKSTLANPLMIAIIIIVAVLLAFDIPVEAYNRGGDMISLFLAPATAALGVSIYSQLETLKRNFLPIVAGTGVGSLVSVSSIALMCKAFGLEDTITAALRPKSVTTPIAIELSAKYGGLVPVTIAGVVITGITGAVLAPVLIKLVHMKDPVAAGVAIGTSSHALGTTKAIELGEIQGAMSGVAIGIAGIWTVVFMLFFG